LKTEWGLVLILENVYEPSDDTWLLLELLSGEIGNRYDLCMDLGCGTGILGLYLLKNDVCRRVVFIDKNPYATLNTMINLIVNNVSHRGLIIHGDEAGEFLREGIFDLVVANPPYLPGESRDLLDEALISGIEGYEIVNLFIQYAYKTLKINGKLYIVYSTLSKPDVIEPLLNKYFNTYKWGTKRFFYETIIAVGACKK